jgi:putative transcriptional regulator
MSRIQIFALGFASALVLVVALRGLSVTTPTAPGLLIPALAPQQQDGEPTPGMFLVATRDLMDPWFGRSVVLLLDHDDGGSLGLIVNRRFQATLSDAMPELEQPEAARHPVFFGGPLGSHQVFMLLRNDTPVPQTQHIAADVYFSAEREVLDHALQNKTPGDALHFYIGYASWTSGQLAHELARGSWHLVTGNSAVVFEDGAEDLWEQLIDDLEPPGIEVRFEAADQLLAALPDNAQVPSGLTRGRP